MRRVPGGSRAFLGRSQSRATLMVNGIRVDLPVEESGDSLLSPNTRRLSHLLSFSRMQLSLGWKTKEVRSRVVKRSAFVFCGVNQCE